MMNIDPLEIPSFLSTEIEWDVPRYQKKILDYELDGDHVYLAISFIDKHTSSERISASIYCFVDGKEYSENMNPDQCRCPYRIISLLTPSKEPKTIEWRRRCWNSLKESAFLKNIPF